MRDFFTFAVRLCFRECETMNNAIILPPRKYEMPEKKVAVKLHLSSEML